MQRACQTKGMTSPRASRSKVSSEELAQLSAPSDRYVPSGVDRGYKYRMLFLVVTAVASVARLLFFPGVLVYSFNFPEGMPNLTQYMQYRGMYLALVAAVYIYSYLKDWHFARVSLLVFAMALTGLVMDFFNVYAFMEGPLTPSMLFFLIVRIAAIVCLFLNAIRDNRAPPMPRRLWS